MVFDRKQASPTESAGRRIRGGNTPEPTFRNSSRDVREHTLRAERRSRECFSMRVVPRVM